MDVMIIIPALNPDENLIDYVRQLKKAGLSRILVVDDGSAEKCRPIFLELEEKEKCIVLRHDVNMGKGRALKDAFNYFLVNFKSLYGGVITVDSDGQHSVGDVIKMKHALEEHPESLILGVRDFSQKNVPFKSSFGNKMTRTIMKLLYGGNISDTQTGLRAVSSELLPRYLTLFGERFEYETGMLIETLQKKIAIYEVGIETIYYEENQSTHFRPLVDSWKIYRLILGTFFRYICSSLSSSVIDLAVFQLMVLVLKMAPLSTRVVIATVFARIISSAYNYMVNRSLVFRGDENGRNTVFKYYFLCICQMGASAALVYVLCRILRLPELAGKVFVDCVLFFVSFRIQKDWVFGRRK